jgi:hypothetical protein
VIFRGDERDVSRCLARKTWCLAKKTWCLAEKTRCLAVVTAEKIRDAGKTRS